MKVLVYSSKEAEQTDLGWHRDGHEIKYYPNTYRREAFSNCQRYYYTLSFSYTFKHDQDTVFFAHSRPYTYSYLLNYLETLENDPRIAKFLTRNTLCRTLAGNRCEYLTISTKDDPKTRARKKGVIITSRVHPGETGASWMMHGLIDFLTSDAPEAQLLREHCVFKIVPMLNPDGVIHGNYRCSLSGCDLNRRWKTPSSLLHPTIFHTKRLCHNLVRDFSKASLRNPNTVSRELVLYCDLHGHSRRKNVFMYGNSNADSPDETKLFPFIMSKLCPFFSFNYSRFAVQRHKENTARITMWRELRVPNVFTLEASFCGPNTVSKNC